MVYQGPREDIQAFFESQAFLCPPRKGMADFLQEICSPKDQEVHCLLCPHPSPLHAVICLLDSLPFLAHHGDNACTQPPPAQYARLITTLSLHRRVP